LVGAVGAVAATDVNEYESGDVTHATFGSLLAPLVLLTIEFADRGPFVTTYTLFILRGVVGAEYEITPALFGIGPVRY
jgi:hypothetical protein